MQKSAYYRTNLIEYFNASEQERYLIINILNINKNSSLTWFNIKIQQLILHKVMFKSNI